METNLNKTLDLSDSRDREYQLQVLTEATDFDSYLTGAISSEQYSARKKLFDEVVELSLLEARREKDATMRNSVTGLYDRKAISEYIYPRLKEAGAKQHFVLHLDVNFLKPINDIYGHDYGDRFLKGVGDMLVASVRGDNDELTADQKTEKKDTSRRDIVMSFGGDEFVIFGEGGQQAIAAVKKRIRAGYAEVCKSLRLPDRGIAIGGSILKKNSRDALREAITLSDAEMYADKNKLKRGD